MAKRDDELDFDTLQPLEGSDVGMTPAADSPAGLPDAPAADPLAGLGDMPSGLAGVPPGDQPGPAPAGALEDLESVNLATGAKKKGKARRKAAAGPSEGLLVRLQRTSPYTVLLGLSLLALLIGALFFILELAAYNLDWSATEGKQKAAAAPVQVVLPNTTATA